MWVRLAAWTEFGGTIAKISQIQCCSAGSMNWIWWDYRHDIRDTVLFGWQHELNLVGLSPRYHRHSAVRLAAWTEFGGTIAKISEIQCCSAGNMYWIWWDYRQDIRDTVLFGWQHELNLVGLSPRYQRHSASNKTLSILRHGLIPTSHVLQYIHEEQIACCGKLSGLQWYPMFCCVQVIFYDLVVYTLQIPVISGHLNGTWVFRHSFANLLYIS